MIVDVEKQDENEDALEDELDIVVDEVVIGDLDIVVA